MIPCIDTRSICCIHSVKTETADALSLFQPSGEMHSPGFSLPSLKILDREKKHNEKKGSRAERRIYFSWRLKVIILLPELEYNSFQKWEKGENRKNSGVLVFFQIGGKIMIFAISLFWLNTSLAVIHFITSKVYFDVNNYYLMNAWLGQLHEPARSCSFHPFSCFSESSFLRILRDLIWLDEFATFLSHLPIACDGYSAGNKTVATLWKPWFSVKT